MLVISGLALCIAMAADPAGAQQKSQSPFETLPDVKVSTKNLPKPGSVAEVVQTSPQVENINCLIPRRP